MVRHLSGFYYFLSSLEEYETGKCQHFHLAAFPLKDGTWYLWIMQKHISLSALVQHLWIFTSDTQILTH